MGGGGGVRQLSRRKEEAKREGSREVGEKGRKEDEGRKMEVQ